MKAALNGVLNLSILDGWYDEAYEQSGGWAIGDRDDYSEDQDEMHASATYSMLENEIVPMYYDRREEGFPEDWMRRVKQCLMNMSPRFNCTRMVEEYDTHMYEPAHRGWIDVRQDQYDSARRKVRWNTEVRGVWDNVRFLETSASSDTKIQNGQPITLRAALDLAGLRPGDVKVEAVVGRVGVGGSLEDTQVLSLAAAAESNNAWVFSAQFVPSQTGRIGYAMRVSPNRCEDPLSRPCRSLMRWS